MNPLTRALTLAEDPPSGSVPRAADRTFDPAIPESGSLGPIRATREDPVPQALSRAALAVHDAPGPEAKGGARLAPLRATRDAPEPEAGLPSTRAIDDASGPEATGGPRLAPLRATRVGGIADAGVPGDDIAALEPPAASRTARTGTFAGVPCDSAGAPPGDAEATRAVTRGDFRSLRRGRGVGRFVGVAISLLAVAGAAVGGTFLWKTELARPSLVRPLPAVPLAVMDLAPVHAANAAVGGPLDPATGTVPRTESPTDHSPAAPREEEHAGGSASTPPNAGHRTRSSKAPRSEGPPNSSAMADSERHLIASTGTAGSAGLPAGSTAVSATQAPDSASTGVPAPGEPANPRGITAAGRAPPAPDQDDTEPPSRAGARVVIRKRMRADHVAASLERAYAAYLTGDVETAGEAYRTVLGHEPRNRDARLGLAAVAARAGRWAEAAEHYATLLASHPADTLARAALIAIAEKDPARAESRLKALLRIEPEAAHLYFSLGNLYASQSRWPEARQSWASAYRLDRDNADHAYNLAVSLDHLSRRRSALGLYREALVLGRSGPASFEAEAVRQRIRALESHPGAGRPPRDPPRETAAAGTAHVR